MTVAELMNAVMALDSEKKKEFILTALPELGREAVSDPAFLPQLLPIMLGLIKDSGYDLAQLLQLATMFSSSQLPQED